MAASVITIAGVAALSNNRYHMMEHGRWAAKSAMLFARWVTSSALRQKQKDFLKQD